MSVIIFLIGVSLFVALIFLAAFVWSVKSGQYEDRYTPSVRMLFDDGQKTEFIPEDPVIKKIKSNKNKHIKSNRT